MYFAHISKDKTREQSIPDHLRGTAELAGHFSGVFGCREWGYGCGMMHDIGKYSDKFQMRLQGGSRTDHATAGAKELYLRKNILASYCVAGHHSGLPDGGSDGDCAGEPTLKGRMKKELEDYRAFQNEIEIPAFPNPPIKPFGKFGFSASFFIRMIFSCLVDADFLDTEGFMSDKPVPRGGGEAMEVLYQRLKAYISHWLDVKERETVNGRRSEILKACLEKGTQRRGLFQLTVPTGGGKTVSSLAFALEHARTHGHSRIIYVIPYTSIIEQNAAVMKEILGNESVLEDHCNAVVEQEEELRSSQLAAENWDRPVVITTNVQFFESLFANKTSKCRKLHNIANSIIIFDEAQMLPVNYLKPCIRAITELVGNYCCSAVLCTATQPSLTCFFPGDMIPMEICPDRKGQYEFFKRTEIQYGGNWSEDELLEKLRNEKQALCILNNRLRAQKLYEALKSEGTYHLSTLMYPKHRKKLMKEMKLRLKNGETCRLIATSLVEAGVDFDFRAVYRELAGIDSVIQAAGRCNREGKRRIEESRTIAFTLEESETIHLPSELKLPISIARQIVEKYEDLASPEAIQEYFNSLYHYKGDTGLDVKDIVGTLEDAGRSLMFPFASVARNFHIIEGETVTILIDREQEAGELVRRIRSGEHSRRLLREVGHYCVSVYQNDFGKLQGSGLLEPMDFGLYRLRGSSQYSEEKGLVLNIERGDAVIW